jgi:putative inorganic carbon (HCO3(-)) transporter
MLIEWPQRMTNSANLICVKTIEWSLIAIIAFVPLIINPGAFDFWYRPKIESVYALLAIAVTSWTLRVLVNREPFQLLPNPLTVPLILYVCAAVLSTVFSIHVTLSLRGDILRMEGLYTVISYAGLVFLFINQTNSKEVADKLFGALIIGATLVSLYALVQYFGFDLTEHFFYRYWRRGPGVGSTIGNPNFLGKYLVLIIPIIFALCLKNGTGKRGLVFVGSLAVCFAALIATFTRASWFSIMIGFVFFFTLAINSHLLKGRGKKVFLIVILLAGIVVFFNFYSSEQAENNVASFKQKESGDVVKRSISTVEFKEGRGIATRLYVWKRALLLIRERPLLGYGLETFPIVFQKFNEDYTKRFNDFIVVDRAHNNYIDTTFALGMIGLVSYCTVILTFLAYLYRLVKRTENPFRQLFYTGVFSGFCGYLINDLFIFSVVSVSPTFWSLMGLTVAAGKIDMKNQKP